MGLFDRFTGKKPSPATPAATSASNATPAPSAPVDAVAPANAPASAGSVRDRLAEAVGKLEAQDLAGALAIYEDVLATSGDRADVLVSVSGELGSRGYVGEIIELVAPLYDAERHGPATGLNLLQAYLAARSPEAAQHMLDVLFALKRPELEDRLHGFSNALAELLIEERRAPTSAGGAPVPAAAPKVALISISKPMWSYGLEAIAADVLPPKEGKLRRIAFAQVAVLGLPNYDAAMAAPSNEVVRLSRGLPLWLAETFYFSPHYAPIAALGILTPPQQPARPMIFPTDWTSDNLRQLVDSSTGGLDYAVTGALRVVADDFELILRVHEVKGFRERKKFSARWTPATADAELTKLQADVRRYMEWSSADAPLAYQAPESPRAWIDVLATSLDTFLVEKAVMGPDRLPQDPEVYADAAARARTGTTAALAYLTLVARAKNLGVNVAADAPVADGPAVSQAKAALRL